MSMAGEYGESYSDAEDEEEEEVMAEEVDVAIVGAGIGGLCAGAILNVLYGKTVGVYESHYLPGGCAHAFERIAKVPSSDEAEGGEGGDDEKKIAFTFDSGPTIVLGCSRRPYNPLRQVLNAIGMGDEVEWIPYERWGMVEYPGRTGSNSGGNQGQEVRWPVILGPDAFRDGPLMEFGGEDAVREFDELRVVTRELVEAAAVIPAMAMRGGPTALIPLLRYLPELVQLIKLGPDLTTGTFAPYLDGPLYEVKNKWLRDWIDALAFSLSGLPASRTSAAAMAYVLFDMHRDGAALDYPRGGLGKVIDALVSGLERGDNRSKLNLRKHVESIDFEGDGDRTRATGLTLRGGMKVRAREGVICNAPMWLLSGLIKDEGVKKRMNGGSAPEGGMEPRQSWTKGPDGGATIRSDRPIPPDGKEQGLLDKCDTAEMTGSFLHLHLAIDAKGLDLTGMEAHYTVMDRGLGGSPPDVLDGDSACGELNMIAVSNPCVLDPDLAPEGYIVVHAYGAGNEAYGTWEGFKRGTDEYEDLKTRRAEVLWRAVESIIPDARDRAVLELVGSPVTHERFLRRPSGTYGAATEDYLPDGTTPVKNLWLCGDGVFPGIGVPAVALSGASAANAAVSPWSQWKVLDGLKEKGHI